MVGSAGFACRSRIWLYMSEVSDFPLDSPQADRDEREFEEGASEVEGDSASVVAGDSEEEGEDLMDNFEA